MSIRFKKWMFFVISFEPSNPNIKFSLYKNGVLEDTQTKVMATGGQYNTSFKIGALTNGFIQPLVKALF